MSRSDLDQLISSASSVDILLYIDSHPGCKKTNIYSNVTRNVGTLEKLREFREAGLLDMDEPICRTTIPLTEKGKRMAAALREIGETLSQKDQDHASP